MLIIGCDYHPSFQQNAWVDTETGECGEQQLQHSNGEAEKFYRDLKLRGMQVRVGMEATGHARWFERLLAELQYELPWCDAAAEVMDLNRHFGLQRSSSALTDQYYPGQPKRLGCG
jgi:transposase